MNYFNISVSSEIIEALGWTLLHSLWQVTAVGLVLGLVFYLLRRYSCKLRYTIALSALILIVAMSVLTFLSLYSPGSSDAATSAKYGSIAVQPDHSNGYSLLLTGSQKQTRLFSPDRVYQFFNENVSIIVLLWILGLLVFMVRFMGGYLYSQRLRSYKTSPVSEKLMSLFREASRKVNVNKRFRLLHSALVASPVLIGYLKPVILVPAGMLASVPPDQIQAILIHELVHFKRKDWLVNIFQSLVEVVFFYHPVVWWISRMIRVEREHICDDMAVECCAEPVTYIKALSTLQELAFKTPRLAAAFTGRYPQLLNRIKRLVGEPVRKSYNSSVMISVITFIAVVGLSASAAIHFPVSSPVPGDNSISPDRQVQCSPFGATMNQEMAAIENESSDAVAVTTMFDGDEQLTHEVNKRLILRENMPASSWDVPLKDTIRNAEERERLKRRVEEAERAKEEAHREMREALRDYREAMDEYREMIREERSEIFESYRNALDEYRDELRKLHQNDTLGLFPDKNLFHLYFDDDLYFAFPPDLNLDFDFEMPEIEIPDSLFRKPYHYWFQSEFPEWEYLNSDSMKILFKGGENQIYIVDSVFKNSKSWKEYGDAMIILDDIMLDKEDLLSDIQDNLRDIEHHKYMIEDVDKDIEEDMLRLNEIFEDIDIQFSDIVEIERIFKDELIDDNLIEPGKGYVIEIDSKEMHINGEKQSKEIFNKYKKILESVMKEDLKEGKTFIF